MKIKDNMSKKENKVGNSTGFFRFRELDGKYLLTNEEGEHAFLSKGEFDDLTAGKITPKNDRYEEFRKMGFLNSGKKNNKEDILKERIDKYRKKNEFLLYKGPSLHIVVVTLRCNHNCLYCQVSSANEKKADMDLDKKTAAKVVDFIFQSPNNYLAIEFQGGEPLLNWPVVKFIIEYAKKKNKKEKRKLEFRLVSNFSLMDDEKKNYLFKNKVIFSTSLDGPEKVHNKNRTWKSGNSHEEAVKWLRKLLKEYKKHYIFQPGAIPTITRFSLPYGKEIIDEYVNLGLDSIMLRPLTVLGVAKRSWQVIGYTPEEFLDFYTKSLDYIIDLNLKKGINFRETMAANIISKVLTETNPNYFELRSPCGAGIGQVAYNYNGDIYTCDEGRMLNEDMFMVGNVKENTYKDLVDSPAVRSACIASTLDGLACDYCVYKPYCGTCPVLNYAEGGNIFPQLATNSRCKIHKGIFDYLFKKMAESDIIKEKFKEWATSRFQY